MAKSTGRPVGTGGHAKDLTSVEIKRISRYMTGTITEYRDRAIFYLGLCTGMRISEIVGLKLRDIMPRGEMLKEIVLERHSTKSKRSRTVPINSQARNFIGVYLDSRWGTEWTFDELPETLDAPLFSNALECENRYQERNLNANYVGRHLSRLFREAGVPNASTHSMRRTFANRLRRSGVDMKTIQELLGHASLATTQQYFSVTDEEKREAVMGLEF